MTTTALDQPLTTTPRRDLTAVDTRVLPDCPPWCIGATDWHDPDYIVVHASAHCAAGVPMSGYAWDAFGGIDPEVAKCASAWLTKDRREGMSVQIMLDDAPAPRTHVLAVATLDEAEALARLLLELVALGREGGAR